MHYLLYIAFFFNLRKKRRRLIKTKQSGPWGKESLPLSQEDEVNDNNQTINLNDLGKYMSQGNIDTPKQLSIQ